MSKPTAWTRAISVLDSDDELELKPPLAPPPRKRVRPSKLPSDESRIISTTVGPSKPAPKTQTTQEDESMDDVEVKDERKSEVARNQNQPRVEQERRAAWTAERKRVVVEMMLDTAFHSADFDAIAAKTGLTKAQIKENLRHRPPGKSNLRTRLIEFAGR